MRNAKGNIERRLQERSVTIEIAVGILAIVFLVYKMRSTLIFGKTTFCHDNILWNYPIFQFFAENIIHNRFPFWNPFTHGGEPLYPILAQLRLWEPITLLTIYLGQFISNDIVILFNWNIINKSLMMAFGVYIVFRPMAMHIIIRLSLIPILLFSSFMVVSFRQCGLFDQFIMIPFVAFFFLRIVYYKDYRWFNWFALAGTIGINWQSYFFTGTWIFLLFFSVGFLIFRRDLLFNLFRSKMVWAKFSLLIVVIFAMAAPSVVLLQEKDRYAFPARMLDSPYEGKAPQGGPQQYEGETVGLVSSSSGINMPYSFIAFTGTFSTIWDFIQFISPDGNMRISWPGRSWWGKPSEAYMYLGLLPWAIAILGMVAGKHDLKKIWLLVLIGFGLLMLGPPGGLHRLMYYLYPPMWFVRHTHSFVLIFIFAFLYFYVLGFNHIFSAWGGPIFHPKTTHGILDKYVSDKKYCMHFATILFSACVTLLISLMARLEYPASNYLFIFIPVIVATGWFLRKDMGEKGLYICLLTSHIFIVLVFTDNYFTFVRSLLELLLFPLALFVIIKTRKNLSASVKYVTTLLLVITFASCLIVDLMYHFDKTSSLYLETPHPGLVHNVKTTPQEPLLPQKRSIFPKHENLMYNVQSTRYLSLIYRQPFVFSPIVKMSQNQNFYDATPTEDVFDVFKKLSFEKWSLLPDGSFSPEYFEYSQDGKDGSVERYINHDGVKELKVLALLRPSSNGNSTIKHKTDKIDDIRGRYIRVSVTAKSENIAPDAIQVTMQDGTGKSISKFYQNGGNWEHLELITDIDKQAEYLQLTCTIKSFATADVLFESIKIEVLPQNDSFDYTNITSSETVFDEYKNFLFHNYSVSADTNYDEYKKFTFEKWVMLPDNNLCPEQFVYKQDKSGGSVERHIFEDEIEGKKVCAFVSPSSDGNSLIMHQTDQIDNLRGRYIRVSAMVKSDNTTSDAIQIDVKDGTVEKNNYGVFVNKTTEVPILKSYENSGTWECIELIKFVGKKTQNLIFTCNVQSTATAGAYFDWVKIDVMTRMGSVPHDKNNIAIEFEGALKSRRWSSFLLPKKYFELIHADIPISSLVEMFAIDKPVFQFKKGYVKVEESGFSDFLSQLGSEKALNLLEESVIIFDEKLPPSLHKLRIPKEEYARENQEFSTTNVKKLASPTGVKRENDFQLSVERYEYDSCDLRVSTDNDGILYWADGYDTGWCAYVDEKEVPVYRANKNFKAIAIPKGTSSVSFVYDPSLFKAGLNLFYGTLVVCFLSMLVSRNYHCMRRGRSLFLFKVGYGVICGMIKVCFFVVLCLFFVRKGRSSLKSYLLSLYKRASSKIE